MPDQLLDVYKTYCETIDLLDVPQAVKTGLKDIFKRSIIVSYKLGTTGG